MFFFFNSLGFFKYPPKKKGLSDVDWITNAEVAIILRRISSIAEEEHKAPST